MSKWIFVGGTFVLLLVTGLIVTWLAANARYRSIMMETEAAWSDIAGRTTLPLGTYRSDMVADLPEVAQRYFNYAIAPGTPLYRRVELTMSGQFLLGDKDAQQTYAMQARQILAPPSEFVWIAQMSKGVFRISGSDGLHNGHGWTRFWMFASLPLVQQAATENLNRAAAARPAIEAIWAPATLLPVNGAVWVQTGPDTAEVSFGTADDTLMISLRIGVNGALREVWTERWSDANPTKTYQLQPFGGIVEADDQFEGFTIPSQLTVGNLFGTPDFLPFFKAGLKTVRYF